MCVIENFSKWLELTTDLSGSSVYKYKRAIINISDDMIENHIINKNLFSMNLFELDIALRNILSNEFFIDKNTRGNNMYSSALKYYRLYTLSNNEADIYYDNVIENIKSNSRIRETEKECIIKSRNGQGIFRNKLIEKYDGKCLVTGIDIKRVLVASHIKPWSVSDNYERLSVDNGLLLSANIDKLFDSGLITFDKKGKMYISNFVGEVNKQRLNISCDLIVDLKATYDLLINLEYHRDIVFVR